MNCLYSNKLIALQGGEFYSDKINLVLTEIGPHLTILYLVHVDEIDMSALKSVSRHCPHLTTLGLYNCDFQERVREESQDDLYFPSLRQKDEMEPLLDLSTLALVSECPAQAAVLLLSAAININHFKTGFNCHLTDENVLQVVEKNAMSQLRSWNMPASKHLTMKTVELLLSNCDHLQ